jgi:hypothetical protein
MLTPPSALLHALLNHPLISIYALQTADAAKVAASSEPAATIAKYALVVSLASALISAVTAYFQFRTHRAKKPAMVISMNGVPPYPDEQTTTYISVKNVGSAATSRDLDITVSCSWMPLLSYKLNLPSEAYCLEPNEEYWWRFRMNDRVVPNSMVVVTVRDQKRYFWKLQQHIESVPSVLKSPP